MSDAVRQTHCSGQSRGAANDTNTAEALRTADGLLAEAGELISLAEAARRLPKVDGRKVCVCTLWRWCRRGLRGVQLEYIRVGRRICTSHEALLRFFAALAALDRPKSLPTRFRKKTITSRQRLRALREADDVLARAGI